MKVTIVIYYFLKDWEELRRQIERLTEHIQITTIYYMGNTDYTCSVREMASHWGLATFIELHTFKVSPRKKRLSISPRSRQISSELIDVLMTSDEIYIFSESPDGTDLHETLAKCRSRSRIFTCTI